MSGTFFVKQLPNGLTVLGEPMEQVASAAMSLWVPAGAAHDAASAAGGASVLSEWLFRGAGDLDSRGLNDALDFLGCHHDEYVQGEHIYFSAAQWGRNLPAVLDLYGDILRRPRLEDATFEPVRTLISQDLAALEDEPARKANMLCQERFYPYPLARCPYGSQESLAALSPQGLRSHAARHLTPHGAILSVAGAFRWEEVCQHVERVFADWSGQAAPPVSVRPPAAGVTHLPKDTAQVHLALAHPAVVLSDERYYAARLAVAVLSGGMSGRLFTEVREKRGLVYHVSTRYHCLKGYAGLFTYAGTTSDHAQETFDVTVGELRRLGDGIEQSELDRSKTSLKSALVMQGESTLARASALAGDWYHLGRLRSLEEIAQAIDRTTVDDLLAYLQAMPARDFTVLIIGPQPVDTGLVKA